MEQKRFLIALLLSFFILFGWSYLFRPSAPPQNNADAPQQAANTPTPSPAQPADAAPAQAPQDASAPAPDDVPQRILTVESELYRVQFDSRGAVPTSWVLKKRKRLKDNLDREEDLRLFSSAGTKDNRPELELISPEGLKRQPRLAPLALETGDKNLDSALVERNYRIDGVDAGATRLDVKSGEQKQISFVLRDPASGREVTKTLTFLPDSYVVNLAVKFAGENQQSPPTVKLAVGPSIGDQGVSHYTFYSVAPEAVYAPLRDDAERHLAAGIHKNEQTPDRHVVPGPANWAGVGDTYFAMVAIPARPAEGLEYRTSRYEHGTDKQERHLLTGFVPVPADGSVSQLYVGPKDYYLLQEANEQINKALGGRAVDLEGLIDYGFGSTITRPLATPILKAIRYLNALTGSYGIAIILFTVIIYSLFFPLKWRTTKSMKKAQKLAPKMKELQEKIKELQSKAKAKQNEAQLKELQMEQLRLMKEGNPLGGCLPLVIQMPFLFALFRAITISLDFRQASFLWMPDLSAADPWRLLPVLMAGSMVVIQWVTPAPSADPLQRKMFMVMLPAMMLYMMWSAPAGLLVYWFVGNLVTFGQQMMINRMIKDDTEPPEKGGAEKVKPSDKPKKLGEPRVSQA